MSNSLKRLAIVLVFTFSCFAVNVKAEKPKIEIKGIRIVSEPYSKDEHNLRPFNWSKGTSLSLFVHVPSGNIIAFDKDSSKLDSFVDSNGNDLKGENKFGSSSFGFFSNISKDKKLISTEINANNIPSKNSNFVEAKGSLAVVTASQKKSFKSKVVPMKIGEKIEAGTIPFEIVKFGKPQWGKEKFEITLKADSKLDSIAEFIFYDDKGNKIEHKTGGRTSSSSFGKTVVRKGFKFPKAIDNIVLEVVYWTDMKTENIPLNLKAGLGM